MALAEWLATHGDPYGSRIRPAVDSIIRAEMPDARARAPAGERTGDFRGIRRLVYHGIVTCTQHFCVLLHRKRTVPIDLFPELTGKVRTSSGRTASLQE